MVIAREDRCPVQNKRRQDMERMRTCIGRLSVLGNEKGMEMVQVAILVAIAIVLGLIFKTEITAFVNKTFDALNSGF